jgi:hypothetical protein
VEFELPKEQQASSPLWTIDSFSCFAFVFKLV